MFEINSLFDASVIVAVFGAMILYFGKIISDISVESHEKLDLYILGGIFTSVWIIIPLFAIGYPIYKGYFISLKSSFFLDAIFYYLPLIIAILLLINVKENIKLKNLGEPSKNSKKLSIRIIGNLYGLWFFSLISIVSVIYWYSFIETETQNFVMTSVLTFFVLTMIAMSFAYKGNKYPKVKIFLQNDPIPIDATVLKYANFILILENGKEVSINKDMIVKIKKI